MKCSNCQTINSVVSETCAGCGADLSAGRSEGLQNRPVTRVVREGERDYSPYVFLALAILYTISPVDLVPDVPIIGWIDDLIFLTLAGANMLEKGVGISNQELKNAIRIIKWIVVIAGVIAIAVLSLLGVVIYKLVWG